MRQTTERPSEQVMRFFTPELYLRFNAEEDRMADKADEAWENALRDYERHLDSIRHKMPSQIRRLSELCLHDAEVLGFEQELQSLSPFLEPFSPVPIWSAVAIVSLKQDARVCSLFYVLWDRLREYPATPTWPFSGLRKHWLYDEIDLPADDRRLFLHRILFSDGTIVEIPFACVIVSDVVLPAADEGSATKRIA